MTFLAAGMGILFYFSNPCGQEACHNHASLLKKKSLFLVIIFPFTNLRPAGWPTGTFCTSYPLLAETNAPAMWLRSFLWETDLNFLITTAQQTRQWLSYSLRTDQSAVFFFFFFNPHYQFSH